MNKIGLLKALEDLAKTGGLLPGKENIEAAQLLSDIRTIVESAVRKEMVLQLTNPETAYYAVEHESWKDYVKSCDKNHDYESMMDCYTEEELEKLWVCSHIEEDMSVCQIEKEVFLNLCYLKMLDMLENIPGYEPVNINEHPYKRECLKAKIRGLYGLIFES